MGIILMLFYKEKIIKEFRANKLCKKELLLL